ncbi:AT-rich interactive domain-containing protein 6-like isoform X2 [Solanum dulcamara]|uniref:AT-rich interactive domain-containing protein 6-like isoform X2 n=1 Tax=Solanum dulcamara TaxID=45834 RepID=UPI00248683C5|nr:AT-rich interactive domain-containing protein 6-like isoform X2 [Solanum dulcamara]
MVDCNINDNKETLPEMEDAISGKDDTNGTEAIKDMLAERENLVTPGEELDVRSCTKSESPGSSILDAKSLQVQNEEDRSADKKVFFKSPTIAFEADGDVNASESQGLGGCRDSTSLDSTEQLDSIVHYEGPVKVRPDDEEPKKRNDGVTGGELCGIHRATHLESCMVHATGTGELKMGVKRCGSFSSNKEMEENLEGGEILRQALMENETKEGLDDVLTETEMLSASKTKDEFLKPELDVEHDIDVKTPAKNFLLDTNPTGEDESGTEEEQAAFMKELETFHKERCLEFKAPRFYGEPLNCLKLWRAVIRLGGYEQVTSCKLWRQVGESFKPPKTCTTVSWTFRCFYEKALLEYEKHKMRSGELPFTDAAFAEPTSAGIQGNQASGSGRARRDAAARAMQGWHSQRLLGNGEVGDPIIKEKNSVSLPKREKQLKSIGLKRKKPSPMEHAVKVTGVKVSKPHLETMVVDIGPPADWVKINVQKTKDCYEVYALVPGLLREEVRVQSDPAGRLVISGQPEQLDNPWGVAPFKKVVSLPSRIDPHQTSAVVTLHGQLFVRVPFEQSNM